MHKIAKTCGDNTKSLYIKGVGTGEKMKTIFTTHSLLVTVSNEIEVFDKVLCCVFESVKASAVDVSSGSS